jgi:hypothetical protein
MENPIGKAKAGRGKSEHTNKHWIAVPSLIDSILHEADIILEILDARFIEKTRNLEMEKKVKSMDKRLIYVFNKSDLVDIQKFKSDIEIQDLIPHILISTKERNGAGFLKKMIKIEAKRLKKSIVNVGVIGYPNTGKSSLINFLVGRSSARTSSEAGYTKGIQKIKLSQGLYLIDTPGIIPSYEKSKTNQELVAKHLQIGATTWDRTKNPDMAVLKLMQDYPGILEKHYQVDVKGDSEELIEQLGQRLHYLVKGGEIDEMRTAKHILKDWQEGKIRT